MQEETCGHRGRKSDPLFRVRNLLTLATEKLDRDGHEKLRGLLQAGDPHGEVRLAWHAKETVREIYKTTDPGDADAFVRQLAQDLQDESCPPEVNRLGRTLATWRPQIVAWRHAQIPQLLQLPKPSPPLRRQTQPEPTPHPLLPPKT